MVSFNLDWKTVKRIDKEYLLRTFEEISLDGLTLIGLDEVARAKGHDYLINGNASKQEAEKSWQVAWVFMSGILFAVPVILGLHLDQPFRSITIFFKGNPTSPMPYGVLILFAWLVVAIYGLSALRKNTLTPEKRKRLSMLGALCGLLFVTYLGVLLSVMKGITLWYSPLKPLQYVVGTLGVGSAVVLLGYVLAGMGREELTLKRLTAWMLVGVAATTVIKAVTGLSGVYYAKTPGLSAAGLAFSQLGLEWVIGLLVPLALLWYAVRSTGQSSAISLAAIAVVIGAFAEKFNLVIGGQLISRTGGILPHEARHIWGTEAWQALGGLALATKGIGFEQFP
ncbi:hypothetical protein SY88_05760 [Clostridiales bacterium PH28_bin88]|nr:hypothetical protein SY88_05760 [Clostridiales bacterium PH28_bin88]